MTLFSLLLSVRLFSQGTGHVWADDCVCVCVCVWCIASSSLPIPYMYMSFGSSIAQFGTSLVDHNLR